MQTITQTAPAKWHRVAIASLFILWGLNVPGATAPFTKITSGSITTESHYSVCAAWGDYDGDGWLDLFVGNLNSRNSLFRNNRDGTFSKVTTGPIALTQLSSTHAAAWADYNNDGLLDLVLAELNSSHPGVVLFQGIGNGEHLRVPLPEAGFLPSDSSRGVGVSWADFDGDGKLDLFVANGALVASARDSLYRNEGDGRFAAVTDNPIVTPELNTTQGAWCDFDNDGHMDLFVTHSGDQGNSLFRNDGSGHFTEIANAAGVDDRGSSAGAAWGDFDNDGYMDLIVTNWNLDGRNSRMFFYRNNGDGTFERILTGVIAEEIGNFVSCAWLDYDNDGWLDLFVTSSGGHNRLYRNLGDGTFERITEGALVTDSGIAAGCAVGDYDNDGFLDVFVAYGSIFGAERNGLYRNDGNDNSWIKIKCVGTVSNRSAIGTKIRVKANIGGTDRWQMRHIVGSEGWLSFNSLDVVVGLGDAQTIDTLRVEWPSGIVQEWHNVPVKQTLTLVEPLNLEIAHQSVDEFLLSIHGQPGQAYRVEASTDLKTWSPIASLETPANAGAASHIYSPAENEPFQFFRAIPE